jgi:uncharacterized cupin superfamily protein
MSKVLVRQISREEIESRGIRKWPIWTKEISRFNHVYDGDEECLFLEGDVVIETNEGNFILKPGDFVVFKDGLDCTWDVRKPVKKHYFFP